MNTIKQHYGKIALVIALIIVTILCIIANVNKANRVQNDPLHDGIAYVVSIEQFTDTDLYLYDVANQIQTKIPFYCEKSELREFRKSTLFYNYKDDILYRLYQGKLINVNEVN